MGCGKVGQPGPGLPPGPDGPLLGLPALLPATTAVLLVAVGSAAAGGALPLVAGPGFVGMSSVELPPWDAMLWVAGAWSRPLASSCCCIGSSPISFAHVCILVRSHWTRHSTGGSHPLQFDAVGRRYYVKHFSIPGG